MKVEVKKVNDQAILPRYQSVGAAGMDLHACIPDSIMLQPMERRMIPTGLSVALPIGFEAQVRARSGLSIKNGITMVNGIGTVDTDYRGEVGVLIINLGQEAFEITPNMRIAQMVIARYEQVEWSEVDQLDDTVRESGGYGSTGHDSE